ncbi:MAG TPA: DUF4911 domain-containing protein [Thermodesulfobacteriota bacterium]|jgi:hypothetical protein|nr:DUF4911 domain-containing protein [Thermodesulfobacteriota bacterium]
MPTIYVKLNDPGSTVYFQAILGTYSHLAWVRTEDPQNGIIKVIPTEDTIDEVREVLRNLRTEIDFEEVRI